MKFNLTPRLFVSKILIFILLAMMFVTNNIYDETGIANISLEIAGYAFLFMSAIGRLWASAYISGKKSKELIINGPYSISRNPLYFFSFLGYIGTGMVFESLVLTAGMGVMFFLTHWNTILSEEKGNRQRFGSVYDEYAKNVPRFIPNPRRFKVGDNAVLFTKPFFRACIGSTLIVFVFASAHFIEWCHINSIVPVLFYIP